MVPDLRGANPEVAAGLVVPKKLSMAHPPSSRFPRHALGGKSEECEPAGQAVTVPTDLTGVMVVAKCVRREFSGFRVTGGDAGQPITDFTDISDFTDFTESGSRDFGKKCEIGKVRKLSDGAFSIASHFSGGPGSARRESRGGRGIRGADKIRDGPPTVHAISTARIGWKVQEV